MSGEVNFSTCSLIKINGYLSLKISGENKSHPICVDFLVGALAYRKKQGIGKNQLIAKAVGVKSKQTLSVLDVTAGLGRDAFVLALLGCRVLMCERSKIIYDLLRDGLLRAEKEKWFRDLSLQLIHQDAFDYFSTLTEENYPDVIYLDPMFPEKNKSALVKKEMRFLRAVVGDDADAGKLCQAALKIAQKRVVVKRSKLAPRLISQAPDVVFCGKTTRFDVYLRGK